MLTAQEAKSVSKNGNLPDNHISQRSMKRQNDTLLHSACKV